MLCCLSRHLSRAVIPRETSQSLACFELGTQKSRLILNLSVQIAASPQHVDILNQTRWLQLLERKARRRRSGRKEKASIPSIRRYKGVGLQNFWFETNILHLSVKDKAQHAVILDKATSDKLNKDVQSYRLITVAVLVDRLKINGSLARKALHDLEEKGQIKKVVGHSRGSIYTRAVAGGD